MPRPEVNARTIKNVNLQNIYDSFISFMTELSGEDKAGEKFIENAPKYGHKVFSDLTYNLSCDAASEVTGGISPNGSYKGFSSFASAGYSFEWIEITGKMLACIKNDDIDGFIKNLNELHQDDYYYATKKYLFESGSRFSYEEKEFKMLLGIAKFIDIINIKSVDGLKVEDWNLATEINNIDDEYKSYEEDILPDAELTKFLVDLYSVHNELVEINHRNSKNTKLDDCVYTLSLSGEVSRQRDAIVETSLNISSGMSGELIDEYVKCVESTIKNGLSEGLLETISKLNYKDISDEYVRSKFNEILEKLKAAELSNDEVIEESNGEQPADEEEKVEQPVPEERQVEQSIDEGQQEEQQFREEQQIEPEQMSVPINMASADDKESGKNKEFKETIQEELQVDQPEQMSVPINMAVDDKQPEEVIEEKVVEEKKDEEIIKPDINPIDAAKNEILGKIGVMIDRSIKDLESSKTIVNSGEYKDLILTLKALNDSKNPKALTADNLVDKLSSIGRKIDKYIEHKAADGVKSNTYKKLAAVQKTNTWVAGFLGKLNVDRAKNYEEALSKYTKDDKDTLPKPGNDQYYKDIKSKADKSITKDTIIAADDCICTIIMKAEPKNRKTLVNMRNEFSLGKIPTETEVKADIKSVNKKELDQQGMKI